MIKGLQKTTLVDYPGKIACTIFISGCNFRCGYCYNSDLVFNNGEIPSIPEEYVLKFLSERKDFLEGVCITGGEPTLYKKLVPLIEKIKNLGYKIKLDTNGSNPNTLKKLIERSLIDYIAMDIKASPESYEKVANVKVCMEKINQSIGLIKNSGIGYEFRTTVVPDMINEHEIRRVGAMIKESKHYFLQQFRPDHKTIDKRYNSMEPVETRALEKFKNIATQYIGEVEIRD